MRLFKKKNLSYILIAAMSMTVLTACGKDDDKKVEDTIVEDTTVEDTTVEDTTVEGLTQYTAKEQGFGGEVSVTVALNKDGSIASIAVDVDSETPELGGVAGPQVAGAILESQSLDVDTVSGATITSTAIKNAVKAALTEAGSDLVK